MRLNKHLWLLNKPYQTGTKTINILFKEFELNKTIINLSIFLGNLISVFLHKKCVVLYHLLINDNIPKNIKYELGLFKKKN